MPFIKKSTYLPYPLIRNKHLQTILPALFRKVRGVPFQRERIGIFDGDFLDLDWLPAFGGVASSDLVIISHGLEGSTDRAYIKGMVKIFAKNGYDVLAWNHRGCSGEPNRLSRFYHSGATDDLQAVVTHALSLKKHTRIFLVGFSLGGNMTLKYLGEQQANLPTEIQKAVVFSVPLHLSACSLQLRQGENWMYAWSFKRKLKQKVRLKAALMPDAISVAHLPKVKTLKDFDELYTAPLHGFAHAEDYYEKCSALYFLEAIEVKTLIINALNDPFLGEQCFPVDLVGKLPNVFLECPTQGGHCGFAPPDREGFYWSERRALEWISS